MITIELPPTINQWQKTVALSANETAKLELMRQATTDPMFMADLQENMTVFAGVDAEWWEAIQ